MSEHRRPPIELLRLIDRSPDAGDGWRAVSITLWPYINEQCGKFPSLVEVKDGKPGRVRLRDEGAALVRWP